MPFSKQKFFDVLPLLLIGVLWLFFFWPMMTGQTVCGFRDSAYLYYPLFQWIDSVWSAGDWPLWNPYCGAGMPVIGDGSSCVFYPGKLIFLVRFLSYPCRYGLFLSVHVLLASLGTYWLARCIGCKKWPAAFAGIAYGFGGPLLTQVSNAIYLIGGAWLPIALGCLVCIAKERRWIWSWGLAGSLACILLGSDPQTVYHVLLIVAVWLAWPTFRTLVWQHIYWAGYGKNRGRFVKERNSLVLVYGLVISGVSLAIIMSMIQLLPSFETSRTSFRNIYQHPRNIYEPSADFEDLASGIFGEPIENSHHAHSYQFSLPPWTLHETFLPNVSGCLYPNNHRYLDYLPGTDRVWYPSLYLGVITVLLASVSFRLWGRRKLAIALTWLVILFTFGAFGWYGAVWAIREILGFELKGVGSQVGSIYWVMATLLPKYVMFRYPAKLFVVASLGLALLAGKTLTETKSQRSVQRLKWPMLIGGGLSLLISLSVLGIVRMGWLGPESFDSMRHLFLNEVGRVDIEAGLGELVAGVGQAFLVLLICIVMWVGLANKKLPPAMFAAGLTILLALDLSYSNRWVLADVKSDLFEVEPDWQKFDLIEENGRKLLVDSDIRLYPIDGLESQEESRLVRTVRQFRLGMAPKHHLEFGIVRSSFSSIQDAVEEQLVSFCAQNDINIIEIQDFEFSYHIDPVTVEVAEGQLWFDGASYEEYLKKPKMYFGSDLTILPEVKYHSWGVRLWPEMELPDDSVLLTPLTPYRGWKVYFERKGEAVRKLSPLSTLYGWGVEVPKGAWAIELRYEPDSVRVGGWVSFFGALVWGAIGVLCFCTKRQWSLPRRSPSEQT